MVRPFTYSLWTCAYYVSSVSGTHNMHQQQAFTSDDVCDQLSPAFLSRLCGHTSKPLTSLGLQIELYLLQLHFKSRYYTHLLLDKIGAIAMGGRTRNYQEKPRSCSSRARSSAFVANRRLLCHSHPSVSVIKAIPTYYVYDVIGRKIEAMSSSGGSHITDTVLVHTCDVCVCEREKEEEISIRHQPSTFLEKHADESLHTLLCVPGQSLSSMRGPRL